MWAFVVMLVLGAVFVALCVWAHYTTAVSPGEAHKRGVKVLAILDKSQRTEKYSSADFVAPAGSQ